MMETDIMVGTGMKVTCSREEFVARLGVVSRAVSTRSSVQILAGVLLRAADGDSVSANGISPVFILACNS